MPAKQLCLYLQKKALLQVIMATKTRHSQRIRNRQKNQFTDTQQRQLEKKYTEIVSSQILYEKFEELDKDKKDILLGMFEECLDIITKKKEPIHITVKATNEFFLDYPKWAHLLAAGNNMISQLLSPNLELLAHEARVWYEFSDKSAESLKMNKQQLRGWRKDVNKAFKKAGYNNVYKGYKGICS